MSVNPERLVADVAMGMIPPPGSDVSVLTRPHVAAVRPVLVGADGWPELRVTMPPATPDQAKAEADNRVVVVYALIGEENPDNFRGALILARRIRIECHCRSYNALHDVDFDLFTRLNATGRLQGGDSVFDDWSDGRQPQIAVDGGAVTGSVPVEAAARPVFRRIRVVTVAWQGGRHGNRG